MCVVSVVGDHYHDKWKDFQWPQVGQQVAQGIANQAIQQSKPNDLASSLGVSRYEFEKLKSEVEEMKKLLERAVKYDKENNEPECQVEEKLVTLRKIAELFGVDLSDILK